MIAARALKGPALVVALFALAGCYRYVPTDASIAVPGEDVRVLVTRLGAAELSEVAPGEVGAGTIEGEFQNVDADDVVLHVPVGERREGFTMVDMMQTIRVPQGEILSMERRELNKVGTGFLIGGAVALGAGIVFGIIDAFGSPTPSEGGDPPEDLLSVVFGRFSFPWGM